MIRIRIRSKKKSGSERIRILIPEKIYGFCLYLHVNLPQYIVIPVYRNSRITGDRYYTRYAIFPKWSLSSHLTYLILDLVGIMGARSDLPRPLRAPPAIIQCDGFLAWCQNLKGDHCRLLHNHKRCVPVSFLSPCRSPHSFSLRLSAVSTLSFISR